MLSRLKFASEGCLQKYSITPNLIISAKRCYCNSNIFQTNGYLTKSTPSKRNILQSTTQLDKHVLECVFVSIQHLHGSATLKGTKI